MNEMAAMDLEIEFMVLDNLVRADAAHIAHLVLEGLTAEADEYATDPAVASRIRRWKAARARSGSATNGGPCGPSLKALPSS